MTHQDIYNQEININPAYKKTIKQFLAILEVNDDYDFEEFYDRLNYSQFEDDWDDYDICVEYGIPLVMVKYFKKKYGFQMSKHTNTDLYTWDSYYEYWRWVA